VTARTRRPSLLARGRDFVRDYTAGMEPDDLRRLLDREAPRVYSVLLRERLAEMGEARGVRRVLRASRLLFLSVSEKLTPARRLIFALALIATFFGLSGVELTVNSPDYGFRVDARPLFFLVAIGGLLFLLATELVERVLVRDELQVARQLQRELLPKASPLVPGWSFAHSSRTANDIGGDYYLFQPLADGRLALAVADASGHGMAAGLLMAITDTALRLAIDLDPAPRAVAGLLHRALRRTGDRRSFLTLFYGLLEPATGRLDWVCAGHPPPLLRRAGGGVEEPVIAGSLPLGAREQAAPASGELTMAPGDQLVLFSDGLFETVGAAGEAFGYERIRHELAAPGDASALHDRLRDALARHLGAQPLPDDLTLVVVARAADAGPADAA
jgi:hypothetical protein